jgi:AraC-like DNA-binding protein
MTTKVPHFQRISHFHEAIGAGLPNDDLLAVHHWADVAQWLIEKAPVRFSAGFYQLSFVYKFPAVGTLTATGPDYLFSGQKPVSERPSNGYVLLISEEFLTVDTRQRDRLQEFPFLRAGATLIAQLPPADATVVTDLYEKLLDEFRSDRAGREAIIRLHVTTLLHYARRYFCEPADTGPTGRKQPVVVTDFRQLLTENMRLTRLDNRPFPRSVAHYADALCVHPYHLNRLVKRATSRTASDLIAGCVLTEARYLLTCTTLPIADIAYRLGFGDPSYFIRFFRKKTAITPLQYRLEQMV